MDRAWKSGASATPPAAPASPSIGYPTSGDAGAGVPKTVPGPHWHHMITEELRNIIVAAGLTPSHLAVNQVLAALLVLIDQYGLGRAQTWQNVLASRSLGVTYYNTTNRPIYVVASCNWVTSGGVNVSVGGVNQSQGATAGATGSFQFPAMAIVPPGQGYVITGGTLVSWFELR